LVSSVPDARTKHHDDNTNNRINTIRYKVDQWRKNGWPGVTSITRQLLEYWTQVDRYPRLYWAQVEAIETLIWYSEIASQNNYSTELDGIKLSNKLHNDSIPRLSLKMATGTGKTVVMAMIIAWQTCNHRENPERFSNQFVVITPGLIIQDRLQELLPRSKNNVYDQMNITPITMMARTKSANVSIVNYQTFRPKDLFTKLGANIHVKRLVGATKHSRSHESDLELLNRVLRKHNTDQTIVVLNDEAHHCYKPGTGRLRAETQEDRAKAALWFNALHMINKYFKRLLSVYDLSATPYFIEHGEKRSDSLFPWTVSDFPLTDAIESGMVKIPRVPIGQTGLESVSCRNVFENTDQNTRKRLDPNNMPSSVTIPLDSLYNSYVEYFNKYQKSGHAIPPVFIIVADTIDNAKAFSDYVSGKPSGNGNAKTSVLWSDGHYDLFSNNPLSGSGLRTLLVHSRIDEDENFEAMKDIIRSQVSRLTAAGQSGSDTQIMRQVLATVGKEGMPGEQIRCVISVSMLTEGWDAKNVTHVFGFRKFGTQLLCEQVSGRALRRPDTDSKNWYQKPTFAEIFGVPFNYMIDTNHPPKPPDPPQITDVFPKNESERLIIEFPLVDSYSYSISPNAKVSLNQLKIREYKITSPLIDPSREKLTGIVGVSKNITLANFHIQRAKFILAKATFDRWFNIKEEGSSAHSDLSYNKLRLFAQMRRNVDAWFSHHNVTKEHGFQPYWLTLEPHISKIPDEIIRACSVLSSGNLVHKQANFATSKFGSTNFIRYKTSVNPELIFKSPKRSQHNCAPHDSSFEYEVAKILDSLSIIHAWTRNHNIKFGWSIPYNFNGNWKKYYPDFVVKFVQKLGQTQHLHGVIEVKGIPDDQSKIKEDYARNFWIPSVENAHLGKWVYIYITNIDRAAYQITQTYEDAI